MKVLTKEKIGTELRDLFKRLVREEGEGLTEERFNQELQRVLESTEAAIDVAENQFVSILICDLRGFAYMVEKVSSNLIIQLLNEYFSTMVGIIDRHGGRVDKFMGDSIIAIFDATSNTSDGILNVLVCAIEMQVAMDEVNKMSKALGLDSLYMGIGINTGEVVAGVLGSDIYREYTVIGSHVNLASRIEAHTLRGQILLSENTYGYTRNAIETGEINEVSAKGMRAPLRFYELKAVTKPQRMELPKRENRKGPRIQIRIPVYYQLLDGKSILPDVHEGEVVDISYGGMLIIATEPIDPFQDIKLRITLTPFGGEAIDIYAKALYVLETKEGSEVGLEFTIIDDDASQSVKTFVDNLI